MVMAFDKKDQRSITGVVHTSGSFGEECDRMRLWWSVLKRGGLW